MEKAEFESLVKQLKAAGLNEEQIMETFFETFQEGKMSREDLESCAEFLGYELTDDFKNDPTPDPIANAGGEGITKEEAEAAKEIQPGESKEEFAEYVESLESEAGKEIYQLSAEGDEDTVENLVSTFMNNLELAYEGEDKPEDKPEDSKDDEKSEEDKEWEEAQAKFKW